MLTVSRRARELVPSATLTMAARAKELKAKGIDVISFSTGEPDFDTPDFIKEAAKRSLDAGFTKYTQVGGIPELKEAIRAKFRSENGVEYAADEIVVTVGAKQAIYNALMALVNDGDEVIIPAPYWVSYPDQVRLCGGVPIVVETTAEQGFRMHPDQLRGAITPRTRGLILNSPSNPTGAAYTAEQLRELAEVAVERGIAIISDEIYEHLVYDGFRHTCLVKACPAARDATIVINGVSKAYAMTGWRMGYAAGPKNVIAKIQELQGQQTSNVTSFVQAACVAALTGPQEELKRMVREFSARRDLIVERLRAIPGVTCNVPEGAFYVLPDLSAFIGATGPNGRIDTAVALADALLEVAHIATVDGDSFGAPGHLRLSYATSRQQIEAGIARMRAALLALT